MDLLKKIELLKRSVDKFEQLTDDLNDSILSDHNETLLYFKFVLTAPGGIRYEVWVLR